MIAHLMTASDRKRQALELLAWYVRVVDDPERVEEWPDLFADEAEHLVVTRENLERGLPVAVIRDDSKDRILDRVTVIQKFWGADRHYNDVRPRHLVGPVWVEPVEGEEAVRHYNDVRPRHLVGPVWVEPVEGEEAVRMVANFAVWTTATVDGTPRLIALGEYRDVVVFTPQGPRFRSKWVVLDTPVLQDVFVYPL